MNSIYLQTRTKKQIAMLMQNNSLEDILIQDRDEYNVGDVFLGIVKEVDSRLNVAFVRLNESDTVFLKLEDAKEVHQGERIVVQIEKLATKSKRVTVSLKVQLQSPYMVLLPYETGVHTSKKLKEKDRERLVKLVDDQAVGLIIRTQSMELSNDEFLSSFNTQLDQWEQIKMLSSRAKKPGRIYQSQSVWHSFINQHNDNVDQIICDDPKIKKDLINVHQTSETPIVFEPSFMQKRPYELNQLSEQLTRREVPLSSGGKLIIDRTEALTIIDIDTSGVKLNLNQNQLIEQINLEAAEACEREVRLRQLSGIILIDFINMKLKESKKSVLEQVHNSFKRDSTITIFGFTKLGIVEMTRKRIHPDVYDQFSVYYIQSANQYELIMNQIEEKLLEYQSSQADQLHLKISTKYNINWNAYLLELKERHELNFSLKLSEDPSLQEPFSLYKIEDGNRVNKQLRQQGIKVDNLF